MGHCRSSAWSSWSSCSRSRIKSPTGSAPGFSQRRPAPISCLAKSPRFGNGVTVMAPPPRLCPQQPRTRVNIEITDDFRRNAYLFAVSDSRCHGVRLRQYHPQNKGVFLRGYRTKFEPRHLGCCEVFIRAHLWLNSQTHLRSAGTTKCGG